MRKSIIILFVIILFLMAFSPVYAATTVQRVSGTDRYLTSVEISKENWISAQTVVLASGENYADALTATPLAYKLNAPILLTQKDIIPATVLNEIKRLSVKNIIVIGGNQTITDNVVNNLESINISVDRIGGKDRFETSQLISKKFSSNSVIIANGRNYADALSIAPYSARNGIPILLSESNSLPYVIKLSLQGKSSSIIVGGENSISATVYNQLPSPKRIAGTDRYNTSVQIIKQLNIPTSTIYLATGSTYADALAGSIVAAKSNAPILLTTKDQLPSVVNAYIDSITVSNYVVLGGTNSISNTLTSQLVYIPPLEGKTIMLDPGHGGSDPGAAKNGYYESVLNLQLAEKIGAELEKLGANVIFTRTSDVYLSLSDRAKLANEKKPNLFLGIHHDSSVDSKANGVSTHYSTYKPGIEIKDVYVSYSGKKYPFIREDTSNKLFYYYDGSVVRSISYNTATAFDPTPSSAAVLGRDLSNKLVVSLSQTGLVNRGSRDHNLYVTRWTNMPSVLFENGFISNPTEVKLVSSPTHQNNVAKKVAETIKLVFN